MAERHPQVSYAVLPDRGVVVVSGDDARSFLQGLVTNDVLHLAPNHAVYAALLSPQGKLLVDFLVTEAEKDGGLYLDCPRSLSGELVKRLTTYKLRARVAVADASDHLRVAVAWREGAECWQPNCTVAAFEDPRDRGLGWRFIGVFEATGDPGAAERYEAHRIALGIPKGGLDFPYGETFAHDANLDLIHGIDFKKGCFIGQEVVSRVEHRGTARKRIVKVNFTGAPPPPGSEIFADEVEIGTFGSAGAGTGLAMIRTDRAQEALSMGAPIIAGGVVLTLAAAK